MDLLRQIVARRSAAADAPALRLSEIESPLPTIQYAPPRPLQARTYPSGL